MSENSHKEVERLFLAAANSGRVRWWSNEERTRGFGWIDGDVFYFKYFKDDASYMMYYQNASWLILEGVPGFDSFHEAIQTAPTDEETYNQSKRQAVCAVASRLRHAVGEV